MQGSVNDGGSQQARAPRPRVRWTKGMRDDFLAHLAATCNVVASAAAIGVMKTSVYHLRRNDPAFAVAWGEALVLGYEMLETRLVGHALAKGDAGDEAAAARMEPEAVEFAMRLLGMHRNATGKPKRGGPVPMFAKPEETDKAILAKLAQIEKRRAKLAAEDTAEAAAAAAFVPAPATFPADDGADGSGQAA